MRTLGRNRAGPETVSTMHYVGPRIGLGYVKMQKGCFFFCHDLRKHAYVRSIFLMISKLNCLREKNV